MIELQGKYNTAKVFCDNIEQEAISQIIHLLNQEFAAGSQIRIMPDTHAGAGCTIGTTMTIQDKVVPNLVGVDIGCGMETVRLKEHRVELEMLDKVIHAVIPAGYALRSTPHSFNQDVEIHRLRCAKQVNLQRATMSLGTLGGGNHFIELDSDEAGSLYLVVHSGSRNLGKQVAEYYQKAAAKALDRQRKDASQYIQELKKQGREQEIEAELKRIAPAKVDKNLAYTQGALLEDYLHDMEIVQQYAQINRQAIVAEILRHTKLKAAESFTTIHNYIDLDSRVLRKGAVSAKQGERLLIPINMRDGSLLCTGRGNPDWNHSAPHGAGRLMSRSAAKQSFTLSQFKKSMEGIYSTTVDQSTLDEAPFAYKPMAEIVANITPTAKIDAVLRPLYNFKAAEMPDPRRGRKKHEK